MHPPGDKPADVDERVEHLICRFLDDGVTEQEQAELAGILRRDAAARALFEEYKGIDRLASEVLRLEMAGSQRSEAPRRRRAVWMAATGVVLGAAAVLAFSFLPSLWSPDEPVAQAMRPMERTIEPMQEPSVPRRTVDFRDGDPWMSEYQGESPWPYHRLRDVRRDLIGIRGANKNVIYLFERDTQATKLVPVSGEI